MALSHKFTSPQGVTSDTAYTKIAHFNGDKTTTTIMVEVYFNQWARNNGYQPLMVTSYTLQTPTTDDIMDGSYAYLKTLPEYEGAVNV